MDNANNAVRSETLPLTIAGNTIFSGGTPTMKAIPFTKCYKLIPQFVFFFAMLPHGGRNLDYTLSTTVTTSVSVTISLQPYGHIKAFEGFVLLF